jgi:hypothetical protein
VEEDIHSKNRRENLKTYSRQQKKPGKISWFFHFFQFAKNIELIWGSLFWSEVRSSPFPPLNQPLYTATQPEPAIKVQFVPTESLSEIQVTTLENGLRVASRK